MKVYTDRQFVKGEKTDIAADKTGSLQMKADKTALQRALKRLEGDEATLKSDTAILPGQVPGTDPDSRIRSELRRDGSSSWEAE